MMRSRTFVSAWQASLFNFAHFDLAASKEISPVLAVYGIPNHFRAGIIVIGIKIVPAIGSARARQKIAVDISYIYIIIPVPLRESPPPDS